MGGAWHSYGRAGGERLQGETLANRRQNWRHAGGSWGATYVQPIEKEGNSWTFIILMMISWWLEVSGRLPGGCSGAVASKRQVEEKEGEATPLLTAELWGFFAEPATFSELGWGMDSMEEEASDLGYINKPYYHPVHWLQVNEIHEVHGVCGEERPWNLTPIST